MTASTNKQSAFISAKKGAEFPLFDITGKHRRERHLLEILEDIHRDLQEFITQRIRSTFGSRTPRAVLSEWGIEPSGDLHFWLSSVTGIHHADEHPVLGISKKGLLTFTEIFFNGDPSAITDEQIKHASVTGTDDRQLTLIYQSIVQHLGKQLGFDHSNWTRKWLENAPDMDIVWTKIDVLGDDWSFEFFFGWPKSMSYEQDLKRRHPIDGAELAPGLTAVPVRLSLEIGNISATMDGINKLNVGDLLPFDLYDTVTAKAGDSECLEGHICKYEGQLCMRIAKNLGTERT